MDNKRIEELNKKVEAGKASSQDLKELKKLLEDNREEPKKEEPKTKEENSNPLITDPMELLKEPKYEKFFRVKGFNRGQVYSGVSSLALLKIIKLLEEILTKLDKQEPNKTTGGK